MLNIDLLIVICLYRLLILGFKKQFIEQIINS
jgi:hypothetical protein